MTLQEFMELNIQEGDRVLISYLMPISTVFWYGFSALRLITFLRVFTQHLA